jgi:polysaccharide export outer membrane protein
LHSEKAGFYKNNNMKKTFDFLPKIIFLLVLFALVFSSCVPMKRIEYLQQEVGKNDTIRTHFNTDVTDYRIQPGDNLYINVKSVLATSENIFAEDNARAGNSYYSDAGVYLNSYLVSNDGFIDFPFVGKIFVNGLTVEEIKDLISNVVKDYIKESTVNVRLALFNITALGEVRIKGQINIYQNRVNIFEAIAMAGDMTDFARRNDVILIRKTENGSKTAKLNLNKADIIESEYYYIMPNDIIYVPPVKGRNFAFAQFPYTLVFSTISTTLLLINFFQTN